uniref:NADH-ubiquinone oxidoreductase chain 4 n=1 Tax=Lissoclinum patella TaxID=13110 RepID=A0A059VIN5_9ASCI|nr:NADH dehydrogenase subunit 4 [Lissoclinum patella]
MFICNNFSFNLGYYLSMDFFSFFFALFTLLLFFIIFMIINKKMMKMLLYMLIILILLVFTTNNFLYFLMFFESVSLMIFFFLKNFGYYKERGVSFFYLFFFNYISSVPFFILVIYLNHSFNYTFNSMFNFLNVYFYFFLFILIFTTKLPMFFSHMWLPKAHVDSPTIGSMLLAGILLKMGAFGMYRYFMTTSNNLFFILMTLCFIGYFFTSTLSMRVLDMKTCIAYSSIYHMNLALVGLVVYSLYGSFYIFLGHAIISPLMFFMVGVVFDFSCSRNMVLLKSFFKINIFFFYSFLLVMLMNSGLPPFLNFFGEVLVFMMLFNFLKMKTLFYIFGFVLGMYSNIRIYMMMTSGNVIQGKKFFFLKNLLMVVLLLEFYIMFSFFF